jgi:peptidoglycan/xylan/chitin deacetylase (PgdA/CDA1 family)
MSVEFNPEGYRDLLRAALQAGYSVLPMREAVHATERRVLLLRHDVDFSLEYAVEMAKAEQQLGIRSTYFLIPYNDYYNPQAPGGRRLVEQIAALGHEVGLHWDSSTYPQDANVLRDHFTRDLATLRNIVGQPVVSASQHFPVDTRQFNVEALVPNEAYSETIRMRFTYVSDSAMKWRGVTPRDLIEQGVEIQFLAHPIWWFAAGATREEKLRAIPRDCQQRVAALCEDFIEYMNGALADRRRYDSRFRSQRGITE